MSISVQVIFSMGAWKDEKSRAFLALLQRTLKSISGQDPALTAVPALVQNHDISLLVHCSYPKHLGPVKAQLEAILTNHGMVPGRSIWVRITTSPTKEVTVVRR